tara:strand:+ start:378 stop:935 length:558 start_codon:yes stop_codon:yes gene_type:complete
MAYNIKDVFYLSTSATVTASGTDSQMGSSQLDLSAYIDPIARGRTKGTGLAVYKVHWSIASDSGSPVLPAEDGILTCSLQAGLGVGDNATGSAFNMTTGLLNTNALNVSAGSYYGPSSVPEVDGIVPYLDPSTEVPYVIVRDNVCLVYKTAEGFTADAILSVRIECAQISLDQATLNQLLRTQTV